MKYLGIAGVVVLAAGIMGLGFGPGGGGSLPSNELSPPSSRPELTAPSASDRGDVDGLDESTQAETPPGLTAPPQEATTSRSSGSRRRSRYPGPIPTPEEWKPPEGPVRIGLQAGHWKANEAPRELSGLRDNGTAWRGTPEWELNLAIAEETAGKLKELGYEVDVLPAVVPPSYRAHLFIAIHADGSNDPNANGYRVATPRSDPTGRASGFAALLEKSYGEVTSLRPLPTVTRRMRNYYAFNFRRYEHALHPMTIGVIIETGFMTSARDRQVILSEPEKAAQGIVNAITAFPITPPPPDSARAARDTTSNGQ